MSLFNFITDEEFRASLEGDYDELQRCLAGNSWKAAHVLSGSLIEAILIDSLVSGAVITRADGLNLGLAKAIDRAKQEHLISDKTADLCSAIRAYRNLIHPGRSIRMEERVDADSASVAASLVKIIVSDVSRKRLENYGYTAEQLLAKIARDSSVEAILGHLLKEAKPVEVERLLLSVLPARYFEASDDLEAPAHLLRAMTVCFRTAFEQASDDVKQKVSRRFVSVLKEGSDRAVLSYGTAFFRGSDLHYLSENDVDLVRDHLLSRCKTNPSNELFQALNGIGGYLEKRHINKFVDPLLRLATSSSELSQAARAALSSELSSTTSDTDALIAKRLATWAEQFRLRGQPERAQVVEEIKSIYDSAIPF